MLLKDLYSADISVSPRDRARSYSDHGFFTANKVPVRLRTRYLMSTKWDCLSRKIPVFDLGTPSYDSHRAFQNEGTGSVV
jgi:hypothetical protein